MKPILRALAVTAPQWPKRPEGVEVRSLTAGSPFSLQNAVRQAAGYAEANSGLWSDSNWTTLAGRQESVLLLEFMDEARDVLREVVESLEPNILLIGAMTLGLPGAVEVARLVRQSLGRDCLIVLGGKHSNETLRRKGVKPESLPCSPLELMLDGSIPALDNQPLFDLMVSGDGEEVVTVLGELVHEAVSASCPASEALGNKRELKRARGDWVAGWVSDGRVNFVESAGLPLDFDIIPTAPSLFGLQSHFPVFDGAPTGHAYSDMGRGCRFDCFFCSERSGLNGRLRRSNDVVDRLYDHLHDIWIAGGEGEQSIGAFVEDSILLSGDDLKIGMLVARLRQSPLRKLRIGCQMTVSDIARLGNNHMLRDLKMVGFDYVAFGMETVNEEVASRMSKHRKVKGLWTEANRRALQVLSENDLRAGVFVLWGLGETQNERVNQLNQLAQWRDDYKEQPCAIGLNWATLHPSGGRSAVTGDWHWGILGDDANETRKLPDFLLWGTEASSPLLNLLVELFGEASERYPFYYGVSPQLGELESLRKLYLRLLEQS